MQKLLTIVVPVYKVEDYINKCLDSLIVSSEMMEKLEVIIVNDGTPDRSAELSREYVNKYPHTFRQIDKENGGHGSAWNVGLKEATGKYIKFLDSDDWFSNLSRLMTDLNECEADIVFNPFNKVYSYENVRTERINTPIKPGSTILPEYWGNNNVNFWSCTYKTSTLKPLLPLFAEGVMFDDYILTWAPLVFVRTCLVLNYGVYNYLLGRPGQSITATQQLRGAISYAKCFEQYEIVRSRLDSFDIPADILKRIDFAISGYASFIFAYMLAFPYLEAKKRMKHLWDCYVSDWGHKSHLEKRYEKSPFCLFFIVERIRKKILSYR